MRNIAKDLARMVYYSSPPFAQNVVHYIIPKQRLFKKHLQELEKSQWFSPEQLEELQSEKLRLIIRHAYKNVPYYRRIFDERDLKPDDIACPNELKKLPVLTKDDVRQHFEELKAIDIERYKPSVGRTGGSTGTPLEFYDDDFFLLAEHLFIARFHNWAQYGSKHPRKIEMRYKMDFPPVAEGKAPDQRVHNVLYLSAFHLKGNNLDDYINRIRAFKPRTINSFASTLYVLAQYMREKGIPPIASLKSIVITAETLFPHFRKTIEEAFGAKVYDWYGSCEGVVSAGECPSGGLHINTEYGVLEVVESNGMAAPTGKPGMVVGTALNKFAMPLIRYCLGDTVILSDKLCTCGRGLPLIASVEGRLGDFIVTRDGRLIGRLDEAFRYSLGIKMSQIVQDEIGKITVRIVKRPNYSEEDVEKLDVKLKERLGEDMVIEYKFVDDIERVGRGKYRFVLSKLDAARLYNS